VEEQFERITTERFEAIDMEPSCSVDHRKLVELLFQFHHEKRLAEPPITEWRIAPTESADKRNLDRLKATTNQKLKASSGDGEQTGMPNREQQICHP
jgi:hypothetical protein